MSSSSLSLLSPSSYFRPGTKTRRYSVIGCVGYECANPCVDCVEKVDVGVGCDVGGDDSDSTCAICFESLGSAGLVGASQKNVATTECGHTFCLSCLLKNLHVSNVCPLCRTPIEKDVKHVLKPLSYLDGIRLLDHELNGLRILEDVEHLVENAIQVSSQLNVTGQNVDDIVSELMTMVTNFGFNLLYDATLHTTGSEQHMDQDWITQMYNNEGEDESDSESESESGSDDFNSDNSDSHSHSHSESESNDEGDSSDDDSTEYSDETNVRIILPEVPESMLN